MATGLIGNMRRGLCEDVWCDSPDVPDALTHVRYIASNKGPAWICQECLEGWMDALDAWEANADDDGLAVGGYPFD